VEPQRPKLNLDELYENDYDVTLNDALDPTLKPLSPQHIPHSHQLPYQQQQPQLQRQYASSYNPFAYQPAYQSPTSASASAPASASQSQPANYHSDSYFSSTDIRRRAVVPAQAARPHRLEYAAAGRAAGGSSSGGAVAGSGVSRSYQQAGGRVAQHFYDDFAY